MTIREAINRLDAEFQETPLGFTVETALQARLLELLRAKVGETIQVRGGYKTADATGYKRKYLDRMAKPQSISSVQPEVNFGVSGDGNQSLDIAILEPRHESEYDDLDYLPGVEGPRVTVRLVRLQARQYPSTPVWGFRLDARPVSLRAAATVGCKPGRNIGRWPHDTRGVASPDRSSCLPIGHLPRWSFSAVRLRGRGFGAASVPMQRPPAVNHVGVSPTCRHIRGTIMSSNDDARLSDGTCQHPLSSIERRGKPDWKNGSQTIWYNGFCMNCGADVEVQYEFDDTVEKQEVSM